MDKLRELTKMYNFRLYINMQQNITRIRSLDLNAHCSVRSTVYMTILHSLLFIHLKQSFPSLSTGDFTFSPRKQANRRRFQAFPYSLLSCISSFLSYTEYTGHLPCFSHEMKLSSCHFLFA